MHTFLLRFFAKPQTGSGHWYRLPLNIENIKLSKSKLAGMATDNTSIFLEITFRNSIESIWDAWTNPTLIINWFGSDPKGKGLKAELDVRPGGYFEITFQDADLTKHTCSGIYYEVLAFSKLTFSWQWKSEPGVESFITVLLIPEGKIPVCSSNIKTWERVQNMTMQRDGKILFQN